MTTGTILLGIATAMIVIYVGLSLLVTVVAELISSFLRARAASLERCLISIFGTDRINPEATALAEFYEHGLIRPFYSAFPLEGMVHAVETSFNQPYFRLKRLILTFLSLKPSTLEGNKGKCLYLPVRIPASHFVLTTIDLLHGQDGKVYPSIDDIENKLRRIIENNIDTMSSQDRAAQALLALVVNAKATSEPINTFQTNLSVLYKEALKAERRRYRQFTQRLLIVVGFLAAMVFNVDSIRVARKLYFAANSAPAIQKITDVYLSKSDKDAESNCSVTFAQTQMQRELQCRVGAVKSAFDEVTHLYLQPVGWNYSLPDYKYLVTHIYEWTFDRMVIIPVGWIITSLALSLGAPFWFSTLQRFKGGKVA